MTDDIVAELDRWLAEWSGCTLLQRACAEIVALRERCEAAYSTVQINEARRRAAAEERERCAKIVESYDYDHMGAVAAAIRHQGSET